MSRGRSRQSERVEVPHPDIALGLVKPPRPAPPPWRRKALLGGGVLAVVTVGAMAWGSTHRPRPVAVAATVQEAVIIPATLPPPDMSRPRRGPDIPGIGFVPQQQSSFLDALFEHRRDFYAGENDLRRGAARMARARAICAALPDRRVRDWVGVVRELTSNGEGKGAMTLSIGERATVGTWHDWFSDLGHWTLMEAGTPAHDAAMTLRVGDKVRFSGQFLPDQTDCVYEQSLTQRGSMVDPEFTFRFEALAKIP